MSADKARAGNTDVADSERRRHGERLACELGALGIAAAAKRAVRTKAFVRNAGGCFWLNGKIAEQFYNAKVRFANAKTPRIILPPPQPPKKHKKSGILKKKETPLFDF